MTQLFRFRTALTGFIGAPGVSTFYSLDLATMEDAIQGLWQSIATLMPVDVKIKTEGFGDIIEDTTGALVGSWTGFPGTEVSGTGTGPYSAPTGILLRWSTDQVMDKHRVRGRTYVVPATGSLFNAGGQLDQANLNGVQTAMSAFITSQSSSFVIWHRPFAGRAASADGKIKAKPAHLGGHALVTGSGISLSPAVLRSRRD